MSARTGRWGIVVGVAATALLCIGPAAAKNPPNAPPLMRDAPTRTLNLPLRHTVWRLTGIGATAVPKPQAATLVLQSQRLGGHSGCAPLTGRYTQQGTKLTFDIRGGASAKACRKSGWSQRYVEALAAVDAYRVEGRQLTLLRGEEVVLTFVSGASVEGRGASKG